MMVVMMVMEGEGVVRGREEGGGGGEYVAYARMRVGGEGRRDMVRG